MSACKLYLSHYVILRSYTNFSKPFAPNQLEIQRCWTVKPRLSKEKASFIPRLCKSCMSHIEPRHCSARGHLNWRCWSRKVLLECRLPAFLQVADLLAPCPPWMYNAIQKKDVVEESRLLLWSRSTGRTPPTFVMSIGRHPFVEVTSWNQCSRIRRNEMARASRLSNSNAWNRGKSLSIQEVVAWNVYKVGSVREAVRCGRDG